MKMRAMQRADWPAVAALIHLSTNYWYETHGRSKIFTAGPDSTLLFCRVYEELDPGCCVLAEDEASGQIIGSCFFHPRETHISLGIMNAHPSWAGRGVAAQLLRHIINEAEHRHLPLRLVSSALNLDSFSLYSRNGFVPRATYQDMILAVPEAGVPLAAADAARMRDAQLADVSALRDLELAINHISREKDYRYFIENRAGIWHSSVFLDAEGKVEGFLASVSDPGSMMIGPGFARTDAQAAALLKRELNARRGQTLVWLVPVDRPALVHACYELGARNCEIHLAQTRGAWQAPDGVNMPTFMPETC